MTWLLTVDKLLVDPMKAYFIDPYMRHSERADNDLTSNSRQAFIWPYESLLYWRLYASLCTDALIQSHTVCGCREVAISVVFGALFKDNLKIV